jgi:hypothetical protein
MPTLAWQERDQHSTLAIIVIALWIFIVPVFVIGFSSTLWAGASRIITAPFGATLSCAYRKPKPGRNGDEVHQGSDTI